MPRKNIKVPEDLFLALRDDKDDQQSWPHYLEEQCLLEDNRKTDAVSGGSQLSYDDVKNACAAAVREELPEAMGG